jgi:hypothetical protein
MNRASVKHFIDTEFPGALRAQIPAALKQAYSNVAGLYETTPFLGVLSAKIGKGHIIGWAVDQQLIRLIEAGKLPFKYKWVSYARPTGRYLLLQLGSSTMSINQLPEPSAVPRDARFRANRALNNAPFFDLPEFDDERGIVGLPHLILGHGYHDLTFAQIGITYPYAQRDGWIYRTPNILAMPHVVESDEPKVEATDAEAIVTLRDELARWVRDNDVDV